MIRLRLGMLVAGLLAMAISACGAVNSAARAIIVPCGATHYWEAAWSPDGQHIAYAAGSTRAGPQIYIMNPDGSGTQQITAEPAWVRHLQWLPDGRTLAFADRAQLLTLTLDGVATRIHAPAREIFNMAFSPDGSMLAYHDGDGIVVRPDLDAAGGLIEVSNGALQSWSPDGAWIATVRGDGPGRVGVYIVRPDGSGARRVAEGGEPVRWSPDGEWISYFTRDDDELHIVRVDGTPDWIITRAEGLYKSSWWPDNEHIAFVSSADKLLKIVDIATRRVERISLVRVASLTAPSWSPDGMQVVFIGVERPANQFSEVQDIYVVNRDGTGQVRLTDNPGRYQCFNWPF